MKKIEIFDPAMCCSTGVCGPSIDPELLRVATVIEALKKKGIDVVRHNPASEPDAFSENHAVASIVNEDGVDVLPITLVDGKPVKKGAYPSNEELSAWSGVSISGGDDAACCCAGLPDCC
jgi:hypothetical protein